MCTRRVYKYHLQCAPHDIDAKFCKIDDLLEYVNTQTKLRLNQKNAYYVRRGAYKKKLSDVTIRDIREPVKKKTEAPVVEEARAAAPYH
jgi:hypothetical protein